MTMVNLQSSYLYLSLDEAAMELGIQPKRLLHAGCIGEVQICINVYARAQSISMRRFSFDDDGTEGLLPEDIEAAKAEALLTMNLAEMEENEREFKDRQQWARNVQEMPAGVYQIDENDLRLFEMAETESIEIHSALKKNEQGWWDIRFDDSLKVAYKDLILLKSEINLLKRQAEEPSSITAERPLGTRERHTLLSIIAALCQHSGLDVSRHAKTAAVIQNAAAALGIAIGESTIEAHLKKIPEALESRLK